MGLPILSRYPTSVQADIQNEFRFMAATHHQANRILSIFRLYQYSTDGQQS